MTTTPQPQIWTIPKRISVRGTSFVAYGVLAVGFLATLQAMTQYIATAMHYARMLGEPLVRNPHLGFFASPYLREIYNPLDALWWIAQMFTPWTRFPVAPAVVLQPVFWILTIGIALSVVATIATHLLVQRIGEPEDADLHDSAHWATPKEIRDSGLLTAVAGPIIGGYEARTKLGRKKIVPLRYDGENGVENTARPGDGKTAAFIKTNLLIPLRHAKAATWSVEQRRSHPWGEEPTKVILDVKGELLKSTSGYQADGLGAHVLYLAPYSDDPGAALYNPLASIRMNTPDEFDDAYGKAIDIADPEGKGLASHWDKTGTSWLAAVIQKCGHRAINTGNLDYFTLPGVADFLASRDSIDDLITDMLTIPDDPDGSKGWVDFIGGKYVPSRVHPAIASAAREMSAKEGPEKTSIHSTALSFLSIYRSERIRRNVMRSTFSIKEIARLDRPVTLYICIPPTKLKAIRPLLRMLTNDFFRTLTEEVADQKGRSVRANVRPVIFVLDEVASLKYLEELETGSGFFRGYGIFLWLFWQSVAQKYKHYTENESLTETMDVSIYGRPQGQKAARIIVDLLGNVQRAYVKRNASGKVLSAGMSNISDSAEQVSRPLLTTFEVRNLSKQHIIAFVAGLTIYLRKWDYWRNPILRDRAMMPQVTKSAVLRDPNAPVVGAAAPKPRDVAHTAAGVVAAAAAAVAPAAPISHEPASWPVAAAAAPPPPAVPSAPPATATPSLPSAAGDDGSLTAALAQIDALFGAGSGRGGTAVVDAPPEAATDLERTEFALGALGDFQDEPVGTSAAAFAIADLEASIAELNLDPTDPADILDDDDQAALDVIQETFDNDDGLLDDGRQDDDGYDI